jgi:hypothetical protein
VTPRIDREGAAPRGHEPGGAPYAVLGMLALLAAAACAPANTLHRPPATSLLPGSPLLSSTLPETDAWVRHHVVLGEHDRALQLLGDSPIAPADDLVRALQKGVVLHEAGDYGRSNELLDWAEQEAERRYTRSVTRGLLSLGVNDEVLAYTPTPSELRMIPFYRMLNHLALDDLEGAAVEARKAGDRIAGDRSGHRRCGADGMLAYLAGVVQSTVGDRNDALVSFRRAEAAFDGCGPDAVVSAPRSLGSDLYRAARAVGVAEVADSAAARYAIDDDGVDRSGGDVLLVIQEGFVAHRASEALHVPIFPDEVEAMKQEGTPEAAAVAALIAERVLENAYQREAYGYAASDLRLMRWASAAGGAYVLRLAWPVVVHEPLIPRAVRVFADDSLVAVSTVGEISPLVARDLDAQRSAMVGRLIARAFVRFGMLRALEDQAEDRISELAAFITGRLANLAANQLETADTRSWSLLPDRISLARLRLPTGTYRLRIETVAEDGSVLTSRTTGPIEVREGALVGLTERVWAF